MHKIYVVFFSLHVYVVAEVVLYYTLATLVSVSFFFYVHVGSCVGYECLYLYILLYNVFAFSVHPISPCHDYLSYML